VSEMPPDPFGPPEELLSLMRGMNQLYAAMMATGFPEHVCLEFIIGVFCRLVRNVQVPEVPADPEA
jgi:hypothetical protein